MKKLIVNSKYNNKKISKFILENIPNLPYGTFCNILRRKDIKLNNKRINKDIIIYENDEISIYIPDNLQNTKNEILFEKNRIIYEDNNILIYNKPPEIEVNGSNSLTDLIHNYYKDLEFKPMPCHRLDRNTSGLILYAKNKESLEILLNKFKNHEIEKHYLAWVYGIISKDEHNPKKYFSDTAYLFKDNKKSMVYISDIPKKGYSKITTSFSILKKFENNTSILDVQIETGKTHQIRAHLAYLGYPIIGDGKYGKNSINKKFNRKYQALCSYILKFHFNTNSGILNYLNNQEFKLKNIDFYDKLL